MEQKYKQALIFPHLTKSMTEKSIKSLQNQQKTPISSGNIKNLQKTSQNHHLKNLTYPQKNFRKRSGELWGISYLCSKFLYKQGRRT